MDQELIFDKIESLHRCVRRIEEKCPSDGHTLAVDIDRQDILTLNLTRAIQLCVDIGAHIVSSMQAPAPQSMADVFRQLELEGFIPADLSTRLQRAVGFRNVAIHEYKSIDWDIVFAICKHHLGDFKEFAASVMAHIEAER